VSSLNSANGASIPAAARDAIIADVGDSRTETRARGNRIANSRAQANPMTPLPSTKMRWVFNRTETFLDRRG
jgi:hypothetical protein